MADAICGVGDSGWDTPEKWGMKHASSPTPRMRRILKSRQNTFRVKWISGILGRKDTRLKTDNKSRGLSSLGSPSQCAVMVLTSLRAHTMSLLTVGALLQLISNLSLKSSFLSPVLTFPSVATSY